jgi:hypothetical protein
MKLFIKILLFVFTALIANVNIANAAFLFSSIQKTTSFSFHNNEVLKIFFKVAESDLTKCCQNENDLVVYHNRAVSVEAIAAKGYFMLLHQQTC